ncbi:beta-lactamase family protein [Streptomyces tricolor]|nr:beta-lactamase family protein [Streptomyces tricolor]
MSGERWHSCDRTWNRRRRGWTPGAGPPGPALRPARRRGTAARLPGGRGPRRPGRPLTPTACGRDVAAGLPVEPDTLWRICSMTKPVTAVAVLLLVEEGRLSWTTRSTAICPRSPSPRVQGRCGRRRTHPPGAGPILIGTCSPTPRASPSASTTATRGRPLCREAGLEYSVPPGAALAETVRLYARMPLQFDPGAVELLGRLQRAGPGRRGGLPEQPLDAFFAERITGPLGTNRHRLHRPSRAGPARRVGLRRDEAGTGSSRCRVYRCTAGRGSCPAAAAWSPPPTTSTGS